jgi:hypothetical protein
VAITQGRHPGVRVFAGCERCIYVSAPSDAQEAFSLAYREVVAANNGKGTPMISFLATPLPTPTTRYGLFGLLAGLSAALGFLVPPRSRLAPH